MDMLTKSDAALARLAINVEMDDRSFLFPDGKLLSHLRVSHDGRGEVHVDAVFVFNETKVDPHLWSIPLEEAREFGRKLIDSAYQAKSNHVLSDTTRVAIIVNTNGFLIQYGDLKEPVELFFGPSVIWRLVHAILRVVDHASPVVAH